MNCARRTVFDVKIFLFFVWWLLKYMCECACAWVCVNMYVCVYMIIAWLNAAVHHPLRIFPFQQVQAQLMALQNLAAMSQAATAAATTTTLPPQLAPATATLSPSLAAAAAAAVAAAAAGSAGNATAGTTLQNNRKRALEEEQVAAAAAAAAAAAGPSTSQQFDQNSFLLAAAAAVPIFQMSPQKKFLPLRWFYPGTDGINISVELYWYLFLAGAAVPCKRPAAEKGGVPVYANGATAQLAAAAQVPQATFNPYLIPGIGYMPTVSCKIDANSDDDDDVH
ncbi:Muscleblind-like protein [Dirofilaria immitis]|nr:Muscleblind-like protein [Dirofilaria immitis]